MFKGVGLRSRKRKKLGKSVEEDFSIADIDIEGFTKKLIEIRNKIERDLGEEDFEHFRKVERWGKVSSALGFASGALIPNPLSAALISIGKTTRWTIAAHHILHNGYDRIDNVPKRYKSFGFAKGWRRYLDWFDWIEPKAWDREHNILHHFRLGERFDPDVFQFNVERVRSMDIPKESKKLIMAMFALTWKWTYYAPSTTKMYTMAKPSYGNKDKSNDRLYLFDAVYLPWTKQGKRLWKKSYLPYFVGNFVVIPAAFGILSPVASFNIFWNLVFAELLTNLHTFLIIVPNDTGDDLYRFDSPIKNRSDFYIRQIIGSVNYKTGTDLNDFFHGWLNYQIEHHVWPDLTLKQYQKVQPKLKKLCLEYGVPYRQESVFKRFSKLFDILDGSASMKVFKK